MNLTLQKVHGFNCSTIPNQSETIVDHIDLEKLMPHVHSVSYYLRSAKDCPLARGNWMLDIQMKDGAVVAYKYPKEMTEESFIKFLQPLLTQMIRGQ